MMGGDKRVERMYPDSSNYLRCGRTGFAQGCQQVCTTRSMKGGGKTKTQISMKRYLLTAASCVFGLTAFCQMGPWTPLDQIPPRTHSGWAGDVQIRNGTAFVTCYTNVDHICLQKIQALAGRQGVEFFGQDKKSIGKYSYSVGRYRTEPGKQTEIELSDAVKF